MTLLFLKVMTMGTLGLLAVMDWLIAATQVQALNTVLNFVSLGVLVAGFLLAPRAFKAKSMEAELKEKDRIIATRTQLADAAEKATEAASSKAAELGAMLDESRHDAAAWQARYEEQSKYTAGPALVTIQDLMAKSGKESERRHKEMLLALRALRHLVPGSPSLDEDDAPPLGPSA